MLIYSYLKGETLQEVDACVALNGEESMMIWHFKLGHKSEQDLKILSEQKSLLGLKSIMVESIQTASFLLSVSKKVFRGSSR